EQARGPGGNARSRSSAPTFIWLTFSFCSPMVAATPSVPRSLHGPLPLRRPATRTRAGAPGRGDARAARRLGRAAAARAGRDRGAAARDARLGAPVLRAPRRLRARAGGDLGAPAPGPRAHPSRARAPAGPRAGAARQRAALEQGAAAGARGVAGGRGGVDRAGAGGADPAA